MNLELGIVENCQPDGCSVRFLGEETTRKVVFSALVKDRIRIRPGQLVAVDLEAKPAEIVWRWYRKTVQEVHGEDILFGTLSEERILANSVPELQGRLRAGDEVWAAGVPDGFVVYDWVENELPQNPEWIRRQASALRT